MLIIPLGKKVKNMTIMGSLYGDAYVVAIRGEKLSESKCSWDDRFIDWQKKVVHLVLLDKPQKYCSKQELKDNLLKNNPDLSDAVVDWEYAKLPELWFLWMPQDAILSQEELEKEFDSQNGVWNGPEGTEPK